MKKLRIASLTLLAFGVGCSHSSSPNATNANGGKIPFFSAGWRTSNYSATFETHKTTLTLVDSAQGIFEDAEVNLWDSTDTGPANGGTVKLNTTTIPGIDHTLGGGGYYYKLDAAAGQTVPMAFDGSQLIFSASGSSKFAALADTINFPNKEISVISPALGASVSKSSNLTVTWTYNSGSSQAIVIQVSGDSIGAGTQYTVADNGSFTIPSSALSSLGTSDIVTISVSRVSYNTGSDANGRLYAAAAFSSAQMQHYLKP